MVTVELACPICGKATVVDLGGAPTGVQPVKCEICSATSPLQEWAGKRKKQAKENRDNIFVCVVIGVNPQKRRYLETPSDYVVGEGLLFASLRIGKWFDSELRHVCSCHGFNWKTRDAIEANPQAYIGKNVLILGREKITENGKILYPRFAGWLQDNPELDLESLRIQPDAEPAAEPAMFECVLMSVNGLIPPEDLGPKFTFGRFRPGRIGSITVGEWDGQHLRRLCGCAAGIDGDVADAIATHPDRYIGRGVLIKGNKRTPQRSVLNPSFVRWLEDPPKPTPNRTRAVARTRNETRFEIGDILGKIVKAIIQQLLRAIR